MVVSHRNEFRGRKQAVGSIMFSDTGRMHYFLGYCPDCKGKCSVTPEEARMLLRRFGKQTHRPMQRVVIRILRKYAQT